MAFAKSVQLLPAGARQVANGVFQLRGRRSGGGGGRKHHPHHKRPHVGLISPHAIRYAKLLAQFRNVARTFNAPNYVNVPGLLLYMYGQSKHDLGAMNVGRTMLVDTAMQLNPQLGALLEAGAGGMGFMGLLGGIQSKGGYTTAPMSGTFNPGNVQSDVTLANALLNPPQQQAPGVQPPAPSGINTTGMPAGTVVSNSTPGQAGGVITYADGNGGTYTA